MKHAMNWRIVGALVLGTACGLAGMALAAWALPTGVLDDYPRRSRGLLQNDFARRWDGTCAGWTRPLVILHVSADCLTWIAYVTIAMVIGRLHPIMDRLPSSRSDVL